MVDIQKGYSRIGRLSSGRASKMLREIKAPKLVMDGSLLEVVEINVTEQEKRTGNAAMGIKDVYTVYLVETWGRMQFESRVKDNSNIAKLTMDSSSLWRRYSEFELLRNYLVVTFPHVVLPPLPEKRMMAMWQQLATVDNFDADFVERRRVALEGFLQRVAAHPLLCQDELFHGFLQDAEGWKERVHSTGFQIKQDSRLKSLSASFRLKKPNRQFEELKNYATELQNNVTSILKIRSRLSDRLYGLHKIHGNYGRVFSEWSGIEQEMGDGLQSAGHHMDVYKDYIDDYMAEEEQIADQLKEYIYFADSLKAVCRKQEIMQFELERCEDLLSSKKLQKDQLTGKAPQKVFSFRGMTSKLFGQENAETKESKANLISDQITDAEDAVERSKQNILDFTDNALKEVDRFKRQKSRDLKEIFISYAVLQIKMAKRGITVWTNTKECFDKM
ncbi:sorting nexin-4 isoform X2 [Strongylocentrotus purpuratus]|uniref:PX domain-containing protein n=1 Tax=Strongylocentrotus purpuratus TaxID=7668 RepID=A0A7M7PV59_STRPU|nr:sorting nexin-4 isoform X2 [Strongylocentrotus purpuratus]